MALAAYGIGVLLLTAAFQLTQGQDVVCYSGTTCLLAEDIGVTTTIRDCCVGNPAGVAYRFLLSEICEVCTVFGFLNNSFTGRERGEAYSVQVGYTKRSDSTEAGTLNFLVTPVAGGTAREGVAFDYTLTTTTARADVDGTPRSVSFIFRADSIAQEPDETLTLRLDAAPGTTIPSGDGVFFQDTIDMTIIDGDDVGIMFSEDDFRVNEGDPFVPVLVTKTSRIATPIVLEVHPLTVEEARTAVPLLLPPNIPSDNQISPPFADLADFNNTVLTVRFEPDDSAANNERSAPVIIFDDAINEATEQVFVVQLRLIQSESSDTVILTERPASLCRIVDNDPIRIGFELPQYTFKEPLAETTIDQFFAPESGLLINGPVLLAKEDDVQSEQTFQVLFQVVSSVPSTAFDMATFGQDILFGGGQTVVTRIFPPQLQKIDFTFTLLADDMPEETEAFQAISTSGGGVTIEGEPMFPQFSNPINLFTSSFIIIEDDDVAPIVIGFEETEYFVNESTQALEVYVRVFDPPDNVELPISVDVVIQSVADSAVGGEDYGELNADELDVFLSFNDATRRLSFNVDILDDSIKELEEMFSLELRFDPFVPAPDGVTFQPNSTTVTIVDNDGLAVSFEEESYTAIESDGYVEVCFLTNSGHTEPIEVEILPIEKAEVPVVNRAISDVDFSASREMRTFVASNSGARLCVNVSISRDDLVEHDKQFLVTFDNLPDSQAGVSVGPIVQAWVTILDDDEPIFTIGPNITVNESTPFVEICVTTEARIDIEFGSIVVVAITGPKIGALNQATGDLDYTHTTLMLTFNPTDEGTQTQCGRVEIIDDMLGNEPDEEFSVTLVNVTTDGSASACITIIDNDTPEVEWKIPDVIIPEGENREVCFTTNIGTAVPYQVEVGTRIKGDNPATGSDYSIQPQPQVITIPASQNGSCFCIDVSAISDTDVEGTEQFELYFENLPSEFATVGEIDTVCVNITDGMPPPDSMICQITEPLRVKPFSINSMYGFMGTCEHVAFSSCQSDDEFNVRVTVDFLTESLENGAVGLHVNDLRFVSREDGSFDDGGQTPLVGSTTTSRQYTPTPNSRVDVDIGENVTSIVYTVTDVQPSHPSFIEIVIVHTHGAEADDSIDISVQTPSNSNIEDYCGLCGSRNGTLLKRDGSIANIMNMAQVQNFAQCNLVEPREQTLRPQRKECGTIRNDTVIGDPLYAAPVYSEDGKEYSLCYEVFGRTNTTLNLVSDTCVNVNARYGPMNNPEEGNIINAIGVRAKGLSDNSCHNIRVDLDGCSANIETSNGNSVSLASMQSFEQDGISVRKYPRRVRIAAPNCENVMLVMWVICENRNNNDMIKFVIARGVNLRASSHGLLGQFWNIPVTFAKYTGNDLPSYIEAPENVYVVTVEPGTSPPRSFLGHFYQYKWDHSAGPCLYVGNAQGGSSFEVEDPNDSVIEGYYREYIIAGGDLFETEYKYNEFEEEQC